MNSAFRISNEIEDIKRNMENGTYDFTDNGNCIGCGACCSNALPMTDKEVRIIKRYIEKKHIKEQIHTIPMTDNTLDMTCPFLNTTKSKDKCEIYQVRPLICKRFICNPELREKHIPKKEFRFVDVRETFFRNEVQ